MLERRHTSRMASLGPCVATPGDCGRQLLMSGNFLVSATGLAVEVDSVTSSLHKTRIDGLVHSYVLSDADTTFVGRVKTGPSGHVVLLSVRHDTPGSGSHQFTALGTSSLLTEVCSTGAASSDSVSALNRRSRRRVRKSGIERWAEGPRVTRGAMCGRVGSHVPEAGQDANASVMCVARCN